MHYCYDDSYVFATPDNAQWFSLIVYVPQKLPILHKSKCACIKRADSAADSWAAVPSTSYDPGTMPITYGPGWTFWPEFITKCFLMQMFDGNEPGKQLVATSIGATQTPLAYNLVEFSVHTLNGCRSYIIRACNCVYAFRCQTNPTLYDISIMTFVNSPPFPLGEPHESAYWTANEAPSVTLRWR